MNTTYSQVELPKYHETFIETLSVLGDGKPMHYDDLRKAVRDTFYSELPAELLSQKTKGGDPLILNRIGWGKVYLKQAGFVYQPSRAMVQITDKGQAALERGTLTLQDIKDDPDFIAYRSQVDTNTNKKNTSTPLEEQSPQDMIDSGVQLIETEVKSELLKKLQTSNAYYFEQVVNDLFERMGYGGAETTKKSNDGGIDGIINQDELGLEKIYIQAKRYTDKAVREPEIRNFIGAMSSDTSKGIFVTTSTFDQKAIDKARIAHHRIILIDGSKLVNLMYHYGVGVQVASTYTLKELDEDYFV